MPGQHHLVPVSGAGTEPEQFQLQPLAALPHIALQAVGHVHHRGQPGGIAAPAPADRLTPFALLLQLQLQVTAAQQFLLHDRAARTPVHRLGVADAERLQPLLLEQKGLIHFPQRDKGLRFHRLAVAQTLQPGLGQLLQPLLQFGQLLGPHAEAPRRRVAAEALQQVGAVLEGPIHGEAPRCPYGGSQPAIALARQQGAGAVQPLHQPGGHDADHAVVPVVLGEQDEGWAPFSVGLEQRQGLGLDRLTQIAALAVEGLALPRQLQGPLAIGGGEQVHHQGRIAQAAHGIDPRRDLEAHRLGIEPLLVHPRQPLQGLQPAQAAAAQAG